MSNYAKAFVSHSSIDKALLGEVISLVSAARWEIDSLTFEEGKTSADQILQSMTRSNLFVLFASKNALESNWVQSEMDVAQQLYFKKNIIGLLVLIIDDIDSKDLPDWLRAHVFARTKNLIRIANLIRARLMQLDSLRGIAQRPFVSRKNLRSEIENKLSDLTNPVRSIFVSGTDGIGRKSEISNSLRDLFPSADPSGINITISDGEGILDAFCKLYIEWKRPTRGELNEFLTSSSSMSEDDLIAAMVTIINEIGDNKLFTWLQCENAVVTDEGVIEQHFKRFLNKLNSNRPTLIIRARRSPKVPEQIKTKNVAFFKVESLSDKESQRLWYFALEHFKVPGIDDQFVVSMQGQISGHPNLIWMAAEYVAKTGLAAIKASPRQFSENLHQLSMSLIDGLPLSSSAKKCSLYLMSLARLRLKTC